MNIGTALAGALLVGLAAPLMAAVDVTTCGSHVQHTDPTAICYDHFGGRMQQALDDSAALRAEGAATGGRTCYRPDDKPAAMVPTWVVMRRLDGAVVGEPFDAGWADATAGRAWTISVCK